MIEIVTCRCCGMTKEHPHTGSSRGRDVGAQGSGVAYQKSV
jgi:hypothetical protein